MGPLLPRRGRGAALPGLEIHIYRTDKKTLAALTADPDISFVRLASVGKMPTLATFAPLPDSYSATEFPLPEKGLAELELEQEYCDRGLAECEEFLTQAARHLPSIRDQMLKTQNAAEYSAVSNSSQTQDGLLWLRGYLPAAQVEEFKAPLPRPIGRGPWRTRTQTMTASPPRSSITRSPS